MLEMFEHEKQIKVKTRCLQGKKQDIPFMAFKSNNISDKRDVRECFEEVKEVWKFRVIFVCKIA